MKGASAWTLVGQPAGEQPMLGLTCSSEALCVAGVEGAVLVATAPDRRRSPPGRWRRSRAASRSSPPSCPTATLCVLSSNNGEVTASTNPARRLGDLAHRTPDQRRHQRPLRPLLPERNALRRGGQIRPDPDHDPARRDRPAGTAAPSPAADHGPHARAADRRSASASTPRPRPSPSASKAAAPARSGSAASSTRSRARSAPRRASSASASASTPSASAPSAPAAAPPPSSSTTSRSNGRSRNRNPSRSRKSTISRELGRGLRRLPRLPPGRGLPPADRLAGEQQVRRARRRPGAAAGAGLARRHLHAGVPAGAGLDRAAKRSSGGRCSPRW